jgi:hypothetical protein
MHHEAALAIVGCLAPNDALQCPHTRKGDPPSMSDTRLDFSAPAILRKWPSVNKERVSASLGARPYMIIDGTLDECIQKLMSQPETQHHLYEIHTEPQADLSARFCPGITSLSWRGRGIFPKNERPCEARPYRVSDAIRLHPKQRNTLIRGLHPIAGSLLP